MSLPPLLPPALHWPVPCTLRPAPQSSSHFTPPYPSTARTAGLAAAGIALVAGAALALVRNICKGRLLQVLCTIAAVVAYYYPKPWTFPSLIVIGGLVTLVAKRKDVIKASLAWAGRLAWGCGREAGREYGRPGVKASC